MEMPNLTLAVGILTRKNSELSEFRTKFKYTTIRNIKENQFIPIYKKITMWYGSIIILQLWAKGHGPL